MVKAWSIRGVWGLALGAVALACATSQEDVGAGSAAATDKTSTSPDAPPPTRYEVVPHGPSLRDAQGRQVTLRGFNFRGKGIFDISAGWQPVAEFSESDCRFMSDELGANFLRLPISWSLLEPTQGAFDDAYLARVLDLAASCHRHGIWSLVDVHQDGWSRFVGDDGAPLWAHIAPLPPADGSGGGGSAFIKPAIFLNTQAFYDQKGGLQDAYLDMLKRLSARIAEKEGVIGLELMNEPVEFPDSGRLDQFYERAVTLIREQAPGLPVYFEPSAVRNVTDTHTPRGPFPVDGSVYAPHCYTGAVLEAGRWAIGDEDRLRASMSKMRDEANTYGSALVVGEIGQAPEQRFGFEWQKAALQVADQLGLSFALWVYEEPRCVTSGTSSPGSCWGIYDAVDASSGERTRGRLRPTAVALYARPFPAAVPGDLNGFAFDWPTRRLTIDVRSASGTFVVNAPHLVYPANVKVTCGDREVAALREGSRVTFDCDAPKITVEPSAETTDTSAFSAAVVKVTSASYSWTPDAKLF